ncbi:MAG: helix-hairpin-helix domain-containing protein [Methanogenium sp.]|jgi:ERCC4-type nuclease
MAFKVYVDSREDSAVILALRKAAQSPALLKTLHEDVIEVEVKNNMESGDIVCGEYVLEHKSISDFRSSLYSGHLNDQIDTMRKNFKACAIIYSGHDSDLFCDNVGTGAFASCMIRGAPVLICGDLDKMAVIALKMLHKWNDDKDRVVNISVNQKRHKDAQLNIITGISGVAEKQGNLLLDRFGSISAICNATIDELKAVHGIGDKMANIIYSALHAERW